VPDSNNPTASGTFNPEQIVLDALRMAHASTGSDQYRLVYEHLHQRAGQRLPGPPGGAPQPSASAQPAGTATPRIRVVCATRKDREEFYSSTALGRSLSLRRPPGVEIRLFPQNSQGLAAVYNAAIAEALQQDLALLFVHDDVHLCDFHWAERLLGGLAAFDILGLAGNRRRIAGQPGWCFTDERLTRDGRENLSGIMGHGAGPGPECIDDFGPAGLSVKLLDGVFLAVRSATLRASSLRFDERFAFHFYDLDFCRQAERAGLRMGTWPIAIVHQSGGGFGGEAWRQGYARYLEKWGE
jgi:GT2 family glycosyltransferase